jgi:hypothetical protein
MGEERKLYHVLGEIPKERKETTRKTKEQVVGWDQNGSKTVGLGVWIGFDWLRIGTGGGLL